MVNQVTQSDRGYLNCHLGLLRRLELEIAVKKNG